jgi:Uma2 family endonuclease
MTVIPRTPGPSTDIPELHSGDQMSREEFHRICEQMPPDFKAELIGGTVYVASTLTVQHGTNHLPLGSLFFTYEVHTPGVQCGDNTTILLGENSEPQPDLYLRILPEHGGQSSTTPDDYVKGPPELVAEIAHSSRSIDLHLKRDDYARYGVREYLLLCLQERRLRWFDLSAGQELQLDADGILRLRCFPGLWIDVGALLTKDRRMMTVLKQGLATLEHAAFIKSLADAGARVSGARRKRPANQGGKQPKRGKRR